MTFLLRRCRIAQSSSISAKATAAVSLMLQGHPGVAELQEQTWPRDTSSVLQRLPVPKTSATLQINPG